MNESLDLSNQLDLKERIGHLYCKTQPWRTSMSAGTTEKWLAVRLLQKKNQERFGPQHFTRTLFYCYFPPIITMALNRQSTRQNEEPTLTSRACSVDSSDGFSRVAGSVDEVCNNHQ